MKIARTTHAGAEIVFYDRETEDRNAIARDLCEKLKRISFRPSTTLS